MAKVAIIVLADTQTPGDMGRITNALEAVKEFKEANDEVRLIFDGTGTKWINELSKPDNFDHELFNSVKDKVVGACSFCAGAFGVKETIKTSGFHLMEEYEGHPSIRKLVNEGYQVITF